jgi:hypothetical protein
VRGVAGFFGQFAHGALQRGLAAVALASGQLQQDLGQWVAVLAHQHHAAIVQQRHHGHGAAVLDEFTRGGAAVGQADGVTPNLEEATAEQRLPTGAVFAQVGVRIEARVCLLAGCS